MPSEDLHPILRGMHEAIASLREDVQTLTGEVKKVHTVIREAAETIRDAIHENIRAQAELKLMDYMMDVRSIKPQIEAEKDQIDTERDELDARMESIAERFQRRHDELDEKASERIRELGSHIFDIHEEQFEAGIEDPFTDQVTTTWQSLQEHNEGVREERRAAIREPAGDVVQSIQEFVDRQEALLDSIRDHRFDGDSIALPGDSTHTLQIPFYVVEYEVDGVRTRKVVPPSELTADGGSDWCSASLSPIEGVEPLVADDTSVSGKSREEHLTERALVDHVGRYGESTALGTSYRDALAGAVPDSSAVPVRVPGGDD